MAIQIVQGIRAQRQNKATMLKGGDGFTLLSDTYLVIRLPDSKLLKLLVRSMLLALVIISLPYMGSTLGSLTSGFAPDSASGSVNLELLPLFFHDLKNEGILKAGERAVIVSDGEDGAIFSSQILSENQMSLVSIMDDESTPSSSIDFAFTSNFQKGMEFIDRTLKVGGVVAVQLTENHSLQFKKPANYQMIYIRQFESTLLAMRKTGYAETTNLFANRRLLGYAEEAKKAALNKLEDVLLEPPEAASRKSKAYLKRTRYLPDLMGDSLDLKSVPRRVYIDVGLPVKKGGSGTGWFAKNYPTRNLKFEMYKINTVTEKSSGKEVVPQIGMSDWLKANVKEEEYVVMKAEADIVEEMVKSKAVTLVDELFLECKPKGHGLGGRKNNQSGRAYWECLALYGKLKDEGVAVHQWWG